MNITRKSIYTTLSMLFVLAGLPQPAAADITAPDPGFGTNGRLQLPLTGSNSPNAFTQQSDGKLLVAGTMDTAGTNQGFVARLSSEGAIDTGFATSGIYSLSLGVGTINGLALQGDDKIVAVGSGGSSSIMRVLRLTTAGALDVSFAGDGIADISNPATAAPTVTAAAIAIQPTDGKIVVVANASSFGAPSAGPLTVFRLNTDGTLDTGFNSAGAFPGFATAAIRTFDAASAVTVQGDGKIVVVGKTDTSGTFGSTTADFAAARFNSDGTLDTTFDTDGKVAFDFTAFADEARAVLIQPDSKIVIAGGAGKTSTGTTDCAMVRLNTDGSLDAGFGTGGKATYVRNSLSICTSIVRLSDGRLTAAGIYQPNIDKYYLAIRTLANGQDDNTFNTPVHYLQVVYPNGNYPLAGHVVQASGKMVLAGAVDLVSPPNTKQTGLLRLQTTVNAPNAFVFTDQFNVALSTVTTSNVITVSGLTAAATVTVSGGEYRINAGGFTTSAGSVNNNDTVQVRHTSSASFATATNTTLTINGVSDTFTSTTLAADTTPDQFTFTDQTGVALSSVITSAAITVSGINSAAPISVSGGEYSINGGAFTAAPGTVNNGNTVQVRHTSSASFATATNTTLTIGGVSDTFTSTTTPPAPDTTPDAFTFTDQTGVAVSTVITSAAITITGINTGAPISVTGGEYSINGGAFTAAAGTVNNGNTVQVRHTSSASFSTATNTVLTVGGVSDTFTSTTVAPPPDTTPDAFTFVDQTGVALSTVITSAAITIAGINTASPISVSGGEYAINGGAFTATAGTVSNGNTVQVRHTSSAAFTTATNTVLTIGGVSDTFTSTTLGQDTTPDAFTFTDQTGVLRGTVVISNNATTTGINAPAAISIVGGEYSINGGAFTNAAGTVTSGAVLRVRVTASASYNTQVTVTLTVGGVSGTFRVTTEPGTTVTVVATRGGGGAVDPWTVLALASLIGLSWLPRRRQRLSRMFASTLVIVMLLAPAAPVAQAGGFYLGLGGGQGDVSANETRIAQQITAATGDAITAISLDGTDFSYHLRAGYTFNRWFSLEVAYYNFGEVKGQISANAVSPTAFAAAVPRFLPRDPRGPALQARLSFPFADRWAFALRGGVIRWESDQRAQLITGGTGGFKIGDNSTEAIWGAELAWQTWSRVGLSLEFNGAQLDDDARSVELGVTWTLR